MRKVTIHTVAVLAAAWSAGCGQASAGCGVAALYTPGSVQHAAPQNQMNISAAHQSLPVGTRVIVRNRLTGRSIIVRVADHSPLSSEGIIDLTTDAMNALGVAAPAPVCVEVLSYGALHAGFPKIAVLKHVANVKHAAAEDKKATSKSLSAHVRGPSKTARASSGKAKRYAQKKSGRHHHG